MAQHGEKLRLLRRIPDIRFAEESRGYSRDQVDRVLASLAPLADEIERLQAHLVEAEVRAVSAEARLIEVRSPSLGPVSADALVDFDETLRNTLVNAQRTAETLVRDAKNEAEQFRSEAQTDSSEALTEARSRAEGITTEALSRRERLRGEAAAERAKMLESAQQEAQQHVSAVGDELAQAHQAEQSRLVDQISDLHHIEGLLQADVGRFQRHLEGRYDDVRQGLDLLNTVVDDADLLRAQEPLTPVKIGAVDTTNYPSITLRVIALDTLTIEAQTAIETTTRPAQAIAAADLDDLAPIPTATSDNHQSPTKRSAAPPRTS